MQNWSTVLFWIFIALITLSLCATYYRTMVLHEYDRYYDDYGEMDTSEQSDSEFEE